MSENAESEEIVGEEVNEETVSYDLKKADDLVSLIKNENEEYVKREISKHISEQIRTYKCDTYHVVILYDEHESISKLHSDNIYRSISDLAKTKDILLILLSNGGKIEPAYLISKTCKRLCKNKFNITIPRQAKSAATLISLGADELHMGLLSELGPIDPQFGGFPALGFSDALRRIASLSSEFPGAGDMFAKYLSDNLSLRNLGYLERINESASQYAERLLSGKKYPDDRTAADLADHFTNHYKDHGFVIDVDEATNLLGNTIIKEDTPEYHLGDSVYSFLNFVDLIYKIFLKKKIRYVGGIEDGLTIVDDKEE